MRRALAANAQVLLAASLMSEQLTPLKPLRWMGLLLAFCLPWPAFATPANRAAFVAHYGRFLPKSLNSCTGCHLPSEKKNPETLEEFPHNTFGQRLRAVAKNPGGAQDLKTIAARLAAIAQEDSDGDGVANETELLLGHGPGDAKDRPTGKELAGADARHVEFARFLSGYRWRPFETVRRPDVPVTANKRWTRNPIDNFIATERAAHGLSPRPEAPKEVLLRRVYLDLIGLSPTPVEVEAFLRDSSSDAYERVVERLLADPRHGERWARHAMDIWRYSDWAGWTDGGQIRDSQPHIWRWRDWIVESLNADKGYDRMLMEMLAADELAPDDTNALRATGFLARNYKMLSREQWMEDTLKHTGQAFLGVTLGCAKCHDHMTDPISQDEYYRMRAIFEPHWVRTDRVPGQTNTALDGLVRVFDTDTNPPTYLFHRGDERQPDTNRVLTPKTPRLLGGSLALQPVSLTRDAAFPDKRAFVLRDVTAASEKALADARTALAKARTNTTLAPAKKSEVELAVSIAEARHASLLATLAAEQLEDAGGKSSSAWDEAARNAQVKQREVALLEAKLKLTQARSAETEAKGKSDDATNAVAVAEKETGANATNKLAGARKASEKATKDYDAAKKKLDEADKEFAAAEKKSNAEPTTDYKPRSMAKFPATSTGRRLAFARWLASRDNPLTARVAVNHIWARHFGQSLVPTPTDFGAGGKPPSHPALLDWLAAELMEESWSLKHLHRLIVTSSTYRMSSKGDAASAAIDPDNIWLWRMNSRRMEAETVRDNLLFVAGSLDLAMGGPEIDQKQGLTSRRRSLYLRCAQEKQVEFLQIFDGPSVVECYERKPTVMPQQALALANSELALAQAKVLARKLAAESRDDDDFIRRACWRVLARRPKPAELEQCRQFLAAAERRPPLIKVSDKKDASKDTTTDPSARARESLVLILFNHHDFVTIR